MQSLQVFADNPKPIKLLRGRQLAQASKRFIMSTDQDAAVVAKLISKEQDATLRSHPVHVVPVSPYCGKLILRRIIVRKSKLIKNYEIDTKLEQSEYLLNRGNMLTFHWYCHN